MKIETNKSGGLSFIQVFSYKSSDYKDISALMSSMADFYPWYYIKLETENEHLLVHYGGWLKDSSNGFDPLEWKYKIEIEEKEC